MFLPPVTIHVFASVSVYRPSPSLFEKSNECDFNNFPALPLRHQINFPPAVHKMLFFFWNLISISPWQSGVPELKPCFDNHLDLFQVVLGSTRLRLNKAIG